MASGAGALGLALGGHAVYDGVAEQRPPLGEGRPPLAIDIQRAWKLVQATTLLWLATGCMVAANVCIWRALNA
jgi:adenosylcobinamide-phosphate synthase